MKLYKTRMTCLEYAEFIAKEGGLALASTAQTFDWMISLADTQLVYLSDSELWDYDEYFDNAYQSFDKGLS